MKYISSELKNDSIRNIKIGGKIINEEIDEVVTFEYHDKKYKLSLHQTNKNINDIKCYYFKDGDFIEIDEANIFIKFLMEVI